MSNSEVLQALRVLKRYCYSNTWCNTCMFEGLREDSGLTCHIQKIIDDDRFFKAEIVPDPADCLRCKWRAICLKRICSGFEKDLMVPDETVTIFPGTVQTNPTAWTEFDDDL